MTSTDDFFIPDNEVKLPEELDYSRAVEYIRSAEAFSRSTYQSVYIIDYFKRNIKNQNLINMKNKILYLLAICMCGCMSMFGQTEKAKVIKPLETTSVDYHSLLNASGYEAFPFDISSLSDGQYRITFKIKEYKDGKEVTDDIWEVVSLSKIWIFSVNILRRTKKTPNRKRWLIRIEAYT